MSMKWLILCRVGRKILTQAVNRCILCSSVIWRCWSGDQSCLARKKTCSTYLKGFVLEQMKRKDQGRTAYLENNRWAEMMTVLSAVVGCMHYVSIYT